MSKTKTKMFYEILAVTKYISKKSGIKNLFTSSMISGSKNVLKTIKIKIDPKKISDLDFYPIFFLDLKFLWTSNFLRDPKYFWNPNLM